MGKKSSSKKVPNGTSGPQMSVTMRQASTGKKQTNAKSSLKLQHLKNLAVWASGEASVPSLAAFFGHHLATASEALGAPLDPSLFTCQRCESILQPGYNCTIRIEKNRTKARNRSKKARVYPQNNVVYTCHFCTHRNVKKGTPKGHMKEICPPKAKPCPKSIPMTQRDKKPASSTCGKIVQVEVNRIDKAASSDMPKDNLVANSVATPLRSTALEPINSSRSEMGNIEVSEMGKVASSNVTEDCSVAGSPATPPARTTMTLLDSKKRKRNRSGAKKSMASESISEAVDAEKNTSNRRRRKSWTSLKEIAERSENDNARRFDSLTIPFLMSQTENL